ncbi:MAG: YbhN family protein [Actinomycetota bacterium]|nr:YbhN family protein [Actinomycetota bacterium]MDH5223857.1 YbhN family protein [Actinomycetota bacterium]MDH5313163.1 YbhN family protein [Actinomycetota bacterium]
MSDDDAAPHGASTDTAAPTSVAHDGQARRIISAVISVAVVGGIFAFAIPKVADYAEVWKAFESLTSLELLSLIAAMIFNLFTYWWANMAALPGLKLTRAAVLTQTTTSVANTLPGGGAIAVGLTYTILKSWGFTGTNVALYVGVTGIWNIFIKLALPVLSIVFLVIEGQSGSAYAVAAVVGVAVLAIAVSLLAALFASERFARRIGDGIGRVISFFLRLFRKPPRTDTGDRAVRFRTDTIGLVERRWLRLTLTTILSQVALAFVLVLSLRNMGVSEQEVSTAQIFAVYSFSRLLSAVPVTPGGVGVIDLGYIGGLAAMAPSDEKAAVVGAVLMFRVLTYGIQIPLGAFTYLIWKWNKAWRREQPLDDQASVVEPATP